jgi:vacuolar iron transporter family protein
MSKGVNGWIGPKLRDIILGGQDGLVNVLGLVLGVAAATNDSRIVLISGLAGTFAESVSMAAVAFTSQRAARDYYLSELAREEREIEEVPNIERKEIRDIFHDKGFRGSLLSQIVRHITGSKKIWLETMMAEELKLTPSEFMNPLFSAFIVGVSSIIGSFVPLVPFFLFPVSTSIGVTLVLSAVVLFATGAAKANITIGDWRKSGFELAFIGMCAALIGYGVGEMLKLFV